ncbi:MAG TPA: FAD-binding oxidoreductase [Terracidiphilus sp.]|jgi:glycolate oxidase FAD binding subunit
MSAVPVLTQQQGVTHLASIVGTEYVSLRGEALVAMPCDQQQIAEILRFARANGLAVTPTGGSTKLDWGSAVAPAIMVGMERLNALREHAWQDMTCTVEAGCSWNSMQTILQRHGQMVALDPLWPDQATVGGIAASNDSGALRLKYGGLRDLIIGMTIVLADGTIAKSGGKVVKNVAGYDIHKLMTGSFGTLGVITEVNFRLHPVEAHARTWTARASKGDAVAFEAPLRALMDSQMSPSSVQIRTSNQECAMDVRIAGAPACLDAYGVRLQGILGGMAVEESNEAAWRSRQDLYDERDSLILKVSMLPSEMCTVISGWQRWASEEALTFTSVAQATGLVTVAIGQASDATPTIIDRLRSRVTERGGSVVAHRIPEVLRSEVSVWGPDADTLPLMREIKQRFDPTRTLNPGRFVGGI